MRRIDFLTSRCYPEPVAMEEDRALEPALRDIESIQSLDTARLALRWALERLRALERRVQDGDETVRRAEAAAARGAAELAAAKDLLARRGGESLERERYYGKLEEYLNLKLAGALDAGLLARREAAVEQREKELQDRELTAERRVKSAKLGFDEELGRARKDADSAAEIRVRQMRDELDLRLSSREREFSSRQLSLHEKQAQLDALERALEERRRRFEEFHVAQRAALDREAQAIAQAARDQTEFLERRVEAALLAKTRAFEAAWETERRALLDELAQWRVRGRETLPAMLAATRRAEESDERALRLAAEVSSARRLAEERLGELMAHDLTEQTRREELLHIESALAAKLRDAETSLFRQYDAWMRREDELRRRDLDWRVESEARREASDASRADVMSLREELKRAIADYRARAEQAPGRRPGEGDTQ
jgi:hypothetical protein